MWQGFLNLNKDPNMTSHDCVGAVRRILKERRVGHGGTLDPMATGVLPLAIGSMTRLLQYLSDTKSYRALIRLGVATTTDDLEGTVIQQAPMPQVTLVQVQAQLGQFTGLIEQIPPSFSAIRQQGKHLYELARAGIPVVAPARTVRVQRLELLQFQPGDYPEIVLDVDCGPGTYIRAIARDLGVALGGCGTLAGLIRTQSGGFHLEHSLTLAQVQEQQSQGTLRLDGPDLALKHVVRVDLDEEDAQALCHGQKVRWFGTSGLVQVWKGSEFLGIARADQQQLQPVTVLGSPNA